MKLLFFSLMLLSTSAFAVNVTFNFTVNSSGMSIYPCDAGLKHADHSAEICYDPNTNLSCDPSACSSQDDCDCICTGTPGSTGNTQYLADFMTANVADWGDMASTPTNVSTLSVQAGQNSFARLFSANNEWLKQVTSLTFNFASERYGSEFYLDVCFRGTQITQPGQGGAHPNYVMKLQSTLTDLVSANTLQYSALSDLNVKITATCDLQGEGTYTGAPTGDALAHQINGVAGGDVTFTTSYTDFAAGSNVVLLDTLLNNGLNKAPRFCKMRYHFLENMRNSSDPVAQIRRWQRQQARISTLSDVTPRNQL